MVRYKELYRFVKPYRGLIAVCIVFHMCSTCLGLLMPWVMKIIIDKALGGSDLSLLYVLLGGIVVLYWTRAFFWYTSNYFTNYPVLRMLFDLRVKLFKHLQSLSLRFYQEYRTGKLISNILTDVSVLQGMVSTVIVGMASSMFALVFVTMAFSVRGYCRIGKSIKALKPSTNNIKLTTEANIGRRIKISVKFIVCY